jgi:hypothetical protein
MKRRRLLQSIAALPAVPAAAQQYSSAAPPADASPKLAEKAPDAVAEGVRRFFTPDQAAALRRLGELIVPKSGDRPGAVEAGAAEFLDFLIGQSGAERQRLYRDGLDRLNAGTPFAQLSAAAAKARLAPLAEAWTYHPPKEAFARFLREAKEDLLQATLNSREFAQAMSRRSRSAAGMGAYWLPLD